jgi:dTDP-glucose 4,6-dehydratase
MKNILVTGGCGFIASNFLNHVIKKYRDMCFINIDALYYCSDINNITEENRNSKNYVFIKGNINNIELVELIFNTYNIDTIIHFAAQSHVDNSFSNPLQYTKDNIMGTHNLLECIRQYGKIEKFIHVSTDEVYGESLCPETDIKSEKSKLNPTNPYSATKAAAEMLVNSYVYSYNLPVIITRGNNVYGPRQYPEKLIPKFILNLLNNKKCPIHGKGMTERSFLYIDDVVEAFDIILNKGIIGEIYNIGTDKEYSVMDITKKLINNIKETEINSEELQIDNYIEYVDDRKYNDKRYSISFTKLNELGWKQKVFIDEGLKKTIDYLRSDL